MRVVVAGLLSSLVAAPAFAERWKSCPKGPDGRCIKIPCEPFLDEVRSLAANRRKADDPRCPTRQQASDRADMHQKNIDGIEAKMATECIAKAAAIMRPVASIDVQRSWTSEAGQGVAAVRYSNNTERTLQSATITCSAMRDDKVIAVGKTLVPGPIAKGATRDVQVTIELGGTAFSCVECDLGHEH